MPAAVGVVHLGDGAHQCAAGVVAPVDGQRIEHETEDPGIGQHPDVAAAEVDPVFGEIGVDVLPQGAARIAGMVCGVEPGQPPQQAGQLGHGVEVDQPAVAAVGERVPHRHGARVVDPGPHDLWWAHATFPAGRSRGGTAPLQLPPSRSAATTPDTAPSSWKPQP